jgi:hypothetical protein
MERRIRNSILCVIVLVSALAMLGHGVQGSQMHHIAVHCEHRDAC